MGEHKRRYTKGSTQYIAKDCEEKTKSLGSVLTYYRHDGKTEKSEEHPQLR